jgi:hypothetical protein
VPAASLWGAHASRVLAIANLSSFAVEILVAISVVALEFAAYGQSRKAGRELLLKYKIDVEWSDWDKRHGR